MFYALIYISICLIFALLLIIAEAGQNSERVLKKERDGFALSALILVWPLTIILMIVLEIFERYKKRQARKIVEIVNRYGSRNIEDCIGELSIQELRTLHYAHKIGATFLSPKGQQLVQQCLIDKSFEKHFLEKNDG